MKSIFQHQAATDNMSFVVKEYYQPHFTSPFHFHDSYELILIAKSYGKLYAGNKVLNFNDGEVYLFGPGFAHCFYNEQSFIKSGEIAHAIVIFFKEDFLGREFFSKGELAKVWELLSKADRGIQLQANDLIRSFFYQITGSKGLQTLILLLQLLNHLSGLKKEEITFINKTIPKLFSKDSNTNKLEAVFKYVIENFKEEVSSKDAASLACLSEAAFCRYFKRRTEKTFSQFVNHVRITHSTSLLLEQDMSIANVSIESGFGNISYFNRQYKKIMGQTPYEYRSAHAPKEAALLE